MIPGIVASAASDGAAAGSVTFANVSLLCSFDGVDGATTTTDDSTYAHTATFNGNAQLDTAQFKFASGVSSALFDGTGDYISFPNHAAFLLSSNPFTIEFFWRPALLTSSRHLVGVWDTAGGSPEKSWRLRYSAAVGGLGFNYSTDGSTEADVAVVDPGFVINTWYHVCFERDTANDLRAYVDGVMLDKVAGFNADFFTSVKNLNIGMNPDTTSPYSGHIDEMRIVKGQAAYATDAGFTPPTSPYPRS